MLLSFVKKIILALSLWSLIILQPVAAASEIVDLYAGQSRTVGNLTLRCLSNSTDLATSSSSSSTSSLNAGTTALTAIITGSVGLAFGTILAPVLKKCCKVCCVNPCLRLFSCCRIPRCCHRQSTEDMDIRIDLLSPAPARSYRLLFENLDASLVDVGWGKYPIIDEDERLVGYKYLFLGDDRQEKASLWLIKEYQGLDAEKGLLRLNNKALRSKASKIQLMEDVYEHEITSNYFVYTQQNPTGQKISRNHTSQSSSSSSSSSSSESAEEAHLREFREAFSTYTPANAKGFIEESLELYSKGREAVLQINANQKFAFLNCGLPPLANFSLYYNIS